MSENAEIAILTEDDVSESVTFINEQVQNAKKAYLEIGQHVFLKFFNGDEKLARSKNPNKTISFNKLLDRHDLMMSRRPLEKAVGTFIQWQQLKELPQGTRSLASSPKAIKRHCCPSRMSIKNSNWHNG